MKGLGTDHVISGPMRGIEEEKTDRQTDGHCNSKTESVQWADSVKKDLLESMAHTYQNITSNLY